MRRYPRLTNAHSKKFENHCHMVALYTVWYNFIRINSAVKISPAMAAGVSKTLWTMDNIVALIDAAPPPKPRGPYKEAASARAPAEVRWVRCPCHRRHGPAGCRRVGLCGPHAVRPLR